MHCRCTTFDNFADTTNYLPVSVPARKSWEKKQALHDVIKRFTGQNKQIHYLGFEVLIAVFMKSTIFWNTTPCSPLKVNRRFEGTYRFHLQARIISRARNAAGDVFLQNVG
jgi:hypothetical protein